MSDFADQPYDELDRRQLLAATATGVGTAVVPGQTSAHATDTAATGLDAAEGPLAFVGAHTEIGRGLVAADALTGERVWTYNDERKHRGAPTVVDGTVYSPDWTPTISFESNHSTGSPQESVPATHHQGEPQEHLPPAKLHAVDAQTGEREWATQLGKSRYIGAPTVIDDTIYLGRGLAENEEDQGFVALDAATGQLKWQYKTNVRSSGKGVNVVDGTLYGLSGQRLYAINADSGELEWDLLLNENATGEGSPVVYNGVVYVGHGKSSGRSSNPFGTLHAVDADTGEELWRIDSFADQVRHPIVYSDETLFVGSGRLESTLTAVDAPTGEILWQDSNGSNVPSPAVANGLVYANGTNGSFRAYDAETGDLVWNWSERDEDGDYDRAVTVYDGRVYTAGYRGETMYLTSFDALTGEKLSETPFDWDGIGRLTAPTIVANPDTGRSVDWRVNNGVVGHHNVWARRASTQETAIVDVTLAESERTLVGAPPEHYTEADFSRETVELLTADNTTQTVTLTVDVSSTTATETLAVDYSETAAHGLSVADVTVDPDGDLAAIVESVEIQESESVVAITLAPNDGQIEATQQITLEWTGGIDDQVNALPSHRVSANDTYGEAQFRLVGGATTAIASGDAKYDFTDGTYFPEEIEPDVDGSEGAFRVWRGQTVSIQVPGTGRVIPIREFDTYSNGQITEGPIEMEVPIRPGTVAGFDMSGLETGRHFVTYDNNTAFAIIQIEELEMRGSWRESTIDLEEDATVAVFADAAAEDDLRVEVVEAGSGEVVATKTVQIGGGGGTSVTFDPTTAFPGGGTYEATITHVPSGISEPVGEVEVNEADLSPIVGENPPLDLNEDGLHRDIDGDGELSVRDVQVFLEHYESAVVQENAAAFNFAGTNEEEVTLADVRALYEDVLADSP